MNKLIVLNGDSGCGKTHLLKLLDCNCSEDIVILKKYSDRDMRLGEENAIEIKPGCLTEEVEAMDYVYKGKNDRVYGFSKRDIDTALQQGKSPIVIIDDEKMLIRLCREYENRVCPIYMQRDITDLDFIEELRCDGRSESQIRERVSSRHKSKELWIKRANLFGYRYIINAPFMKDGQLLEWFQLIAKENNIDIEKIGTGIDIRGIVNYFRTLWKDRPTLLSSDRGSKPIIDEYNEMER